jgi:hypothetical protein
LGGASRLLLKLDAVRGARRACRLCRSRPALRASKVRFANERAKVAAYPKHGASSTTHARRPLGPAFGRASPPSCLATGPLIDEGGRDLVRVGMRRAQGARCDMPRQRPAHVARQQRPRVAASCVLATLQIVSFVEMKKEDQQRFLRAELCSLVVITLRSRAVGSARGGAGASRVDTSRYDTNEVALSLGRLRGNALEQMAPCHRGRRRFQSKSPGLLRGQGCAPEHRFTRSRLRLVGAGSIP